MRRVFGYFLLVGGVFIALFVWYAHTKAKTASRPFSSYSLLSSSWDNYKKQFINDDGRVIDHSRGDITTSEGQSYAMLRAVWVDDKDTFQKVWKWTHTTLKRRGNNLFGWNWGKKQDGTYGFIQSGDANSATDADSDIAFALILASKRWNDPQYLNEAQKILTDIWREETDTAGGKRYLIAGTWARSDKELIVNPSYFAPYEWRVFAKLDKKRDWNSLIEPAYELLNTSGQESLDKSKGVGLPPNWVAIDRTTGKLTAPTNEGNLNTDYSYDAIRVPWRIAVDYQWNNDSKARDYLTNSFKLLEAQYTSSQKLGSQYAHDGQVINQSEDPAMYATFIGAAIVNNPDLAKKIYEDKILKLYSTDQNTFNKDIPYYQQNWLWFGAALYEKRILSFY